MLKDFINKNIKRWSAFLMALHGFLGVLISFYACCIGRYKNTKEFLIAFLSSQILLIGAISLLTIIIFFILKPILHEKNAVIRIKKYVRIILPVLIFILILLYPFWAGLGDCNGCSIMLLFYFIYGAPISIIFFIIPIFFLMFIKKWDFINNLPYITDNKYYKKFILIGCCIYLLNLMIPICIALTIFLSKL